MASSYFTESEAPRDFRVSSTESDGHYTKCLLCYTVKRNFYCAECIRTGNFVHSSMPYADRYAEKQAKLLRLKSNRKYILDRCEKLLLPKLKKDTLLTEAKQSRDRLDLLRLAIEQRKSNIEEKRKALVDLKNYNNELQLKLPRYHKRVSTLGKHAQQQSIELNNKVSKYNDKTESLASLRRSRIRQLTKYIFPVYMTYDTSDSIEDMEFIGSDTEDEPPKRSQLHIVAPWITTDGDFSHLQAWIRQNKDAPPACNPSAVGAFRTSAALALAAQLLALLAWTLDTRLPHALQLTDYCNWRISEGGVTWRVRRVCACAAVVCVSAHAPDAPPAPDAVHAPHASYATHAAPHPLTALHALAVAANTDDPMLGRAFRAEGAGAAWVVSWAAPDDTDDAEPEHLCWPDREADEPRASPPAPAPSLVTSAAASLASMWRGWSK